MSLGLADIHIRCAVNYNSPRVQASHEPLYNLLLNTQIIQTSTITKTQNIRQDDEVITLEVAAGKIHILENPTGLQIFIPRGQRERELCYLQHLPDRLADLLGLGQTAREVLTKILNITWSSIDAVLNEIGIIDVPGLSAPLREISTESDNSESEALEAVSSPQMPQTVLNRDSSRVTSMEASRNVDTTSSTTMPNSPTQSSFLLHNSESLQLTPRSSTLEHGTWSGDIFGSPAAGLRNASNRAVAFRDLADHSRRNHFFDTTPDTSAYRDLLEKVIRLAQFAIQASFPVCYFVGSRNLGDLSLDEHSDLSATFGLRIDNPIAYNMKIGAAGELYVSQHLHSF